MRYIVTAKDWNDKFVKRFGTPESSHELADFEIVHLISTDRFGRAEIDKDHNGVLYLDFHNDYD